MRRLLKGTVERVLAAPPVLAAARWARRHDALVLAYHDVVPDDAPPGGDRPLHLPRRAFAEQMDRLIAACDVVPLAELARPVRGARRRPRAAITFDDAYAGALSLAVDELVVRGLPATIFVAPALLGRSDTWWDALSSSEGLAPELREAALGPCAGRDEAVRAHAAALGVRPGAPVPHHRIGTLAELRAALARPGIAAGSHTWSHPNLAALAPSEVEDELVRSRDWLEATVAPVVPWLAYPYGLASPAVQAIAARCGYEGACLVTGGWWRPPAPAHATPRYNVSAGLSDRGFSLRASGLFSR